MIFISAILHIKLAQEPVAGGGPERCSPAGGEDEERADHLRVRGPDRLHPQHQPHAHHHRHRQEAEQDHCQYQPGREGRLLVHYNIIRDIYSVFPGVPDVESDQRIYGEDRGNPREAPDRNGERERSDSSATSPVMCCSLFSLMLVG